MKKIKSQSKNTKPRSTWWLPWSDMEP